MNEQEIREASEKWALDNINEIYEYNCRELPHSCDIFEHLPTLYNYAKQCEHITELGTREGISSWAFLKAHPKVFVTYDLIPREQVQYVIGLGKRVGIDCKFIQDDTRDVTIEPTDLLFIDTLHAGPHLYTELISHADKVSKFIIIHDTETFGYKNQESDFNFFREAQLFGQDITHMTQNIVRGQNKMKGIGIEIEGLKMALKIFQDQHPEWKTLEHFTNCNGLTILRRV